MSESRPAKPRRRWTLRFVSVLVLLALAAVWLLHGRVGDWAVRQALARLAVAMDADVAVSGIDVRIGHPIGITGISLRAPGGTAVDVARVEISLTGPGEWFGPTARWLDRITVRGVEATVAAETLRALPPWELDARPPAALLPRVVEVLDVSGTYFDGGFSATARNVSLTLAEGRPGRLGVREVFWSGTAYGVLGPLEASTSWKDGVATLGGLAIRPGLVADTVEIDVFRPGGPSVALSGEAFGGAVRGDFFLGPKLEAAVSVQGVPLEPLSGVVGLRDRVAGRLVEGKLTFRGDPARPAEAEGSLRLSAQEFRWNDRGWESLEIGASLIHRRLAVSEFDLRQKENRVSAHGEISLSEGWREIAKAPFLLNVRAEIKEPAALANLTGGDFASASGEVIANGSLSGRDGEFDGFLNVEGRDITYRGLPATSLRLEAVFRKRELEVAKFEMLSGKDVVRGQGSIHLAKPHPYAGSVEIRVADVGRYLAPFVGGAAASGSLDVRWSGDGTPKANSGAFDIKLDRFNSAATPRGLSGRFTGTYSPQNIHLSEFGIFNGPLRLVARVTAAASGLTVKDVEIRSAKTVLLSGEAFLPLDVFATAAAGGMPPAMDESAEAYLSLTTPSPLEIADLWELAGQQPPFRGVLRTGIEVRGKPAALAANGTLTVSKITSTVEPSLPESALELALTSGNGTARWSGTLATKGFPPLQIDARVPFGLVRTEAGGWTWIDPSGSFEATATFPRTDLAIFRPFLPRLRTLAGQLSGALNVGGTVAAPAIRGQIDLEGGQLEVSARTPQVSNVRARIEFDGAGATVRQFTGDIGAGAFAVTGGMQLDGPTFDLRLTGDRILLGRDAGFRLRANVDLRAAGRGGDGSVTGTVRLVEGRIYRRLEITPLLVPVPGEDPLTLSPPYAPGAVPQPFARWALNVKVENETPFLLKGNLADGEIVPELLLGGTLGTPVPTGRISLRGVRAFLPFTTLTIPDGRIDFLPDTPWVPLLDIRGTAPMPDYEVQAYLFGPLNENKLILRSDPPLPQESLALLLTTGIAPGVTGGAGFGEVAIGQGGLLLLRQFARGLDVPGLDMEDLVSRLSVSAIPAQSPGERTALRGNVRLWDQFELMTGRDGFGFYQAGVTYTWRFR